MKNLLILFILFGFISIASADSTPYESGYFLSISTGQSRVYVNDIFDPFSKFTPSGGSWGQHGIVRIHNSKDFVLFVTFGQSQAEHTFDESITHAGVLSWQSQPRQSFKSNTIQLFINQDHHKNNIHLFLRTSKKDDYTYFGRLKYLKHDAERENPVYFQWPLLNLSPKYIYSWPYHDNQKVYHFDALALDRNYGWMSSQQDSRQISPT